MYKNSQGETVSVDQMQIWADANDMSIDEYASRAGYTLSDSTETKEIDSGKMNGGETPGKKTTPIATPSRASMIAGINPADMELSSEDTSLDLQEFKPDPVKVSKELEKLNAKLQQEQLNLKNSKDRSGKKLAEHRVSTLKNQIEKEKNKIFDPKGGISVKDSFSLADQTEEVVREALEEAYPIQIEETDIFGNAINYKDPRTGKTKYIKLKASSYEEKLKTAAQLDELKYSFDNLTAEEFGSKVTDTFIDRFKTAGDQDIEELNYGLKGTGYEIKAFTQGVRSLSSFGAPTVNPTSLQVYKNGELVNTSGTDGLGDFFNKNLTEEDNDILKANTYSAYKAFNNKVKEKRSSENSNKDLDFSISKDYVDSGSFSSLLERTLFDTGGLTEKEASTVKNYLDNKTQTRKKIKARNGRTSYATFTSEEYLKYKTDLSGLPEDIRNKLNPKFIEKIYNDGRDMYKEKEIDQRMVTISEYMLKESGKQNLLKLASRYTKEEDKEYKEKKNEHKAELIKRIDNAAKILKDKAEILAKQNPGAKFGINVVNNQYLFTAEMPKGNRSAVEEAKDKKALADWYTMQNVFNDSQADFQEDIKRWVDDIKQYESNQNDLEVSPQELFDLSIKEYGTGALLAKDLNDTTAGLLLSVATLFDPEWAVKEQKRLNEKSKVFETMLTYDQALEQGRSGLFSLRTLSQQAPNIIAAVATSSIGTGLQLSKIATQLAVGTTFGVSSGAQKYRDLILQQELGDVAKNQKELNKIAYDTKSIDYKTYISNDLDLNKTIAMGDLTDEQITAAAWATFFIEGSITSFLGTAPNTLKLVKDFSKGGVNIGNFVNKTGWQRLGATSFELGKRLGGEVLEEELIYFGDTALSEGLILGRDMDFSQWDDTAVSAIITSGSMSTPGVAYSALMTNAATNEFNKTIEGLRSEIEGLSLGISLTADQGQKDILTARLAIALKAQGAAVAGLEVDAIALGAENQKSLLALKELEQQLLSEAGVKRGDSKTIAEDKVKIYKEKLISEGKDQQAKDFDTRRSTYQNQQNDIKKDINYDVVENALGTSWGRINERLENKKNNSKKANDYRSLNKKDKLAFVISEIANEQKLHNVNLAKADENIAKKIDNKVDKKGKLLSQAAKNKLYAEEGSKLLFRKSRAVVITKTTKISKDFLDVSKLKIIDAGTREGAMAMLEGETNLTTKQKNEIWKALENPESNGYIYNNRYVAINKKQADIAVNSGDVLASTAIVHEMAHAVNDRVFNTEAKQRQYRNNIYNYLSKSTDKNLNKINSMARSVVDGRSDLAKEVGKKWEDTSDTYKDEYATVVQEILYAYNFEMNLEVRRKKEGFFRGVDASTPEGAFNYLLNRNADTRAGVVGRRVRKKISEEAVNVEGKSSLSVDPAVQALNAELEELLDNEYEMDEGDFESQKSNLELKIRQAKAKVAKPASEVSKKPSIKKEGLTKEKADGKRNFTSNDKNDLFSTANTAFNNAARYYRINLRLDKEGNPEFTKEEWDAVPLNTKLGIGVMIGEKFKPYVEYLMGSRRDVPGFDEFASQIIERTATGLEKGDDGIPFLLKTYDPSKGTKITTHVFGQINNRLQGVINKTKGFGESTVDTALSETNRNQLVSEETADSNINTEERARSEGKKKEFAKITDEVIVLDNNGKATTISEKVATEVKNAVKVVYATTKFKNKIGTKEYRTELVNALRNKLGNLFISIMNRGVNYNNDSKVGNPEKRANYDAFVDSNFQSVYSIMPKSTISDRFPFLMEPVLNEDGTPYFMSAAEVDAYNEALDRGEIRGKKIANKYAGNKVFKKRPYNAQVKKEGTEYLKANDQATNVRNARKTSFADVIAEEAALDILPEVLRENGFEKEAVIEQIEQQIGRGKFSIKGLTPGELDFFVKKLPIVIDHLRTSTRPYNTQNIRALFKEVYAKDGFEKAQLEGIIKQFSEQLNPFNKVDAIIKEIPGLIESVISDIVNQTDQNKFFVDLAIRAEEKAALEKKYEIKITNQSIFNILLNGDPENGKIGDDVKLLSRGHAITFAENMVKKWGVQKTIQYLISFGNPTWNSTGVSGEAQVYRPILKKFVKNPKRSRFGFDLFTKKPDFLSLLKKIDPTIIGFTSNTITRRIKGKKIYEKIEHKVLNGVTQDMANSIYNETYNPTEQHSTAEAAKEFAISFLEYIGTVEDPVLKAVLGSTLNSGSNNVIRAAAKITHVVEGYDSKNPKDLKYEHSLAARLALSLAYDYYVNKDISIDIESMWKEYQVSIIPNEMDTAISKAGFGKIAYAGYTPGKGFMAVLKRYYNIFTMGKVQYALKRLSDGAIIGRNFADLYKENGGKTTVNKNIVEDISEYRASVELKEANKESGKNSLKSLSNEFNLIIERDKGVESYKTFSKMVARRRGASAGKFKYWMPSSLDDFKGLTSYTFSGKGRQGDADQKFFNDNLINPYFAGIRAIETSKQTFKNDITGLNKMFKPTVKMLKKLTPDGDYTYDQAIRVYLWTKSGFEIEGLSKRDALKLNELVANDENLAAYADGLQLISKREKWVKPSEYWDAETLLSDLNNMTEKEGRKAYLEEFIDNANAIFSKENLYKIEALYGTKHADALKDILFRMENGTNRPSGSNKNVNKFNNWLNNSIGAIMFFNRRSALLQTLSTANFINWSDNNPVKAALAFANQPQFWKDFAMIFNSDMLKQRRSGLKTDVSEAEIATAAKGAKNKASAVLSYLLKIGFTPTQMVDSFAIASGGSAFYRNRVNTYKAEYVADGDKLERKYTDKEAEAKAFVDFSQISEETQQSGDPALISSDQASVLGRVLLSFQNTPIQLNRSIKKAAQDIYNRRRTPGTTQMQSDLGNVSKIIYFGAIQSFIFSALQTALFALIPGFGDEDDDLTEEEQLAKYNKIVTTKESRIINGMVDTTLKGGFGLPGAVVSTIKNVVIEYNKQEDKGFLSDHAYTLLQAVNLSPPVGSKLRKLYTAIQTNKFEKDAIKQRGFDVTINGEFNLSPSYSVIGNVLEGGLNIPMARMVDEVNSVTEALDARNSSMQRLALGLGWKTWDVSARNEEHDLIKTEAKAKRKEEGVEKAKETRATNKKEYDRIKDAVLESFTNAETEKWLELPKKEEKAFIEKIAKRKGIK